MGEEDEGKVENGEENCRMVKNKQEEKKDKDMQLETKNSALEETMRESQRLLRELQEGGKKEDNTSKNFTITDGESNNKSTANPSSLLAEMRNKYVSKGYNNA